ncbi:hypothetical protein HanPI659440_Chr05g0205651 [Helianthus annuus]|nr:hypothetical protein HanPI659440_Chr05g0205651 [Helianthus annuus]
MWRCPQSRRKNRGHRKMISNSDETCRNLAGKSPGSATSGDVDLLFFWRGEMVVVVVEGGGGKDWRR